MILKTSRQAHTHTHTHTVALWGTFLHRQLNFVVYVLGYACAVVARGGQNENDPNMNSVNTNSSIGFRSILGR